MPRPLKWGILGASTISLSKDIDKYAFMCGSNFYESDVICKKAKKMAESSQLILPLILDDYNYNYDDGDYFDDFGVSERFQIFYK